MSWATFDGPEENKYKAMLFYDFKDYEGFKELFGIQHHGNGAKSRRNKILLSYIKDPKWIKMSHDENPSRVRRAKMHANLKNMTDLFWALVNRANNECMDGSELIRLLDFRLWSNQYHLDDYAGLCEDGDVNSIRYVRNDNGRVFKKKCGRFLHDVLMESKFGQELPEPVMKWLCEEFTQRWQTHASEQLPEYTLHVDDAFDKIYSSRYCKGYFGSCMTDDGYWTFYRDAVKARAAYLTDSEGLIVARCVIYDDVLIETGEHEGEKVRLAERQYSTDGVDLLKRVLVDKLVKAGEIDGYKKVGADCHSPYAFVWNDGTALSEDMSIRCVLDHGDTVSYQDTFKYYDIDSYRADNHGYGCIGLEDTDGRMEDDDRYYDEYHDEYTDSVTITVYYHGREITCAEDNLDDFVYVDSEGDYYHDDDVVYSNYESAYVVENDAYYSDVTEDWYSNESDKEEDEREWYENNGYVYSEYDDEWFEDEDDVVTIVRWFGSEETISKDSLARYFSDVDYDEERGVYVEKR